MEEKQKVKRELTMPITKSCYMDMTQTIERQRKIIKRKDTLILAMSVVMIAASVLLISMMDVYKTNYERTSNSLKEAQQQRVELEKQVKDLQEQNKLLQEKRAEATYPLTDAEREAIEDTVMAEAEDQGYTGQVLVAQCIRNASEIDGLSPQEVLKKYKYAKPRKASESVKMAVADVFDNGVGYTDEPILYFYAPSKVDSEWHESLTLALEHKEHRFFKRNE